MPLPCGLPESDRARIFAWRLRLDGAPIYASNPVPRAIIHAQASECSAITPARS